MDPKWGRAPGSFEAAFRKGESVTVAAGESTHTQVSYAEFDPASLKGEYSVTVQVLKQDGAPAAGLGYQLRNVTQEFGWQVITSGTLDADGRTTFAGLAGGKKDSPLFRLHSSGGDGNAMGRFKLDSGPLSRSLEFKLPPVAGDIAPDITLTDQATSAPVKLSSFRGQVVFLDFWATWCGPCQEPMAHNEELIAKNGEAWKDKAIILGASVDDDTKTLAEHLKTKGWSKTRQLWCPGTEPNTGFKAPAAQSFGIEGIPTALLIDQQGKIIWRGHPSGYDIEEEIAKLLK